MIDAIVRQRVADELENHMSKNLLKELDEIYREIEQVKLELFNSYVISLGTVVDSPFSLAKTAVRIRSSSSVEQQE